MNDSNPVTSAASPASTYHEPADGGPKGLTLALVFLLFLATGASGLVYQVVWQRQLLTVFGATIYSVSTVLAAFMGGLALGSWVFGARSERMRNPLAAYGALEIAVGLLAMAVPTALGVLDPVFRAAYRTFGANFLAYSAIRFVFVFAILLVPTTLMGATIPLLAKFLAPGGRAAGRRVGVLYAVNTFGAVAGTFLSGFFLLGTYGISRTTWLAAALNIGAGLAALGLAAAGVGRAADVARGAAGAAKGVDASGHDAVTLEPADPEGLRYVYLAYAVSGSAALGLEVAWSRSLVFTFGALKNTTYSFTAMLATFLIGIAAGSAAITPFVQRVREPRRLFASLMALTGILSVFSVFVLYHRTYTVGSDLLPEFDGKGVLIWWAAVGQVFLKSASVVLPATFCMGLAFPVAVKAVTEAAGDGATGRAVGRLYSLNTLGAILGSVLTGFVILPLAGIAWTILTLGAVQLAAGSLLLAREAREESSKRWFWVGLTAVVLAVAGWKLPRGGFQRLEPGERTVHYEEGPFATVSVVENTLKFRTIYVDNVGVAGTEPMLLTDQKSLAHVPMVLLPNPKSALTVGFGSGGASYSYTLYPELERIDCVEITKTVPNAAPYLTDSNRGVIGRAQTVSSYSEKPAAKLKAMQDAGVVPDPAKNPLWNDGGRSGWYRADKRFNIVLDDARSYLRFTPVKYDIIATDCTDLRYKTNANLYDSEYFRLCRDNITDDGMVVVWMPLGGLSDAAYKVALRTFHREFPEMETFYMNNAPTHYVLLIGTKKPLKVDMDLIRRRLANPAVSKDLGEIGLANAEKLLSCFLIGREATGKYLGEGPLNTEDYPYLEFESPKYGYGDKPLLDNLAAMMKFREEPERLLADASRTSATLATLAAYSKAVPDIIEGHRHYRELRMEDAAKAYKAALALNPDDVAVKELLAFDELRRKSDGQRDSAGLWAQVTLGGIYAMQGRDEEAVGALNAAANRSVTLPPDPSEAAKAAKQTDALRRRALREAAAIYEKRGLKVRADEMRAAAGAEQK